MSCTAAVTQESESFVSSVGSRWLMGSPVMFNGQGQALPSHLAKKGFEPTRSLNDKKGFEPTRRGLNPPGRSPGWQERVQGLFLVGC